MTEPTLNATPRRIDAMTIDEFYEVRNNMPALPSQTKSTLPFTGVVTKVYDLDDQQLTVAHVDDTATMRFTFNGATAELDLVQTKALVVAIAADLDRWRNAVSTSKFD